MRSTQWLGTLIVASVMLGACAANGPQIRVIGVDETQRAHTHLIVFVEVVNPSQTEMVLSKLEYDLRCDSDLQWSGTVSLSGSVRAGSSMVLQIPIEVGAGKTTINGSSYVLKGRLYAVDQRLERSWRVFARGTFHITTSSATAPRLRIAAN